MKKDKVSGGHGWTIGLLAGIGGLSLLIGLGAVGWGAGKLFQGLRTGEGAVGKACVSVRNHKPAPIPVLTCRVLAPDGSLVPGAEVRLKASHEAIWNGVWTCLDEGRGEIMNQAVKWDAEGKLSGRYDVLIRAAGFAPTLTEIELPFDEPVDFSLIPGRTMVIRLIPSDDRPIPSSLRPQIQLDRIGFIPQADWDASRSKAGQIIPHLRSSALIAEPLGDGTYSLALPPWADRLHVLVDEPGYLRCFLSDAIEVEDQATVDLQLSEPAEMILSLGVDEDLADTLEHPAVYAEIISENLSASVGSLDTEFVKEPRVTEYFAPGDYRIHANIYRRSHTETVNYRFTGTDKVHLKPGEKVEQIVLGSLVSKEELRGDGRAALTILLASGAPAIGVSYEITYSDNAIRSATIAKGTIGDGGVIRLENLKDQGRDETYFVNVDDEYVGHFFFRGTNRWVERSFSLPVSTGDIAPVCSLQRVVDGSVLDLASLRGRVVYLDFWATWCGPCQGPMGNLQGLAERRATSWGDQVALIGVSIDDDRETVLKHLEENGWMAPIQVWAPGGGWKSEAAVLYGLHSVPTGVLIDPMGQIVWRGHPGHGKEDLEAQIEKLLAKRK
ncbi:MAG: redoxin family protein [Verrucomicrobia bacterium]|nr:redoxin family protein [Verrucomicrobiota bacterium]